MEENEARIIDFQKICRLCLHEKRILTEIFESSIGNNNLGIDQKIMACAAVNLRKDDGLPAKICIKCLANVNAAFDFRIQCQKADRTLHDINKLLIEQFKIEDRKMPQEKYDAEVEIEKEQCQTRKSIDLNHVIVIKKQEKKTKNEDSGNLLPIISNSNKDMVSKEKTVKDILVSSGQEVIAPSDSLNSQLLVEEAKEFNKASNEISFAIQEDLQETYKVIMSSSQEEVITFNDPKLKDRKKGDGDLRKSPCPFCNKMLTRVDEHVRLLHRNRVYICTKHNCGAEFLTLKNLQSHQLRCYNMEKAYKCYRCFKEFHRKSNYKAHIRRHSDVKDFQCQLCDRAFVDSTGLRRHFLKHHEPQQETFVSGCCGKKFKSKEGLKKHIQKGICGIRMFHIFDSSNVPIMEVSELEVS